MLTLSLSKTVQAHNYKAGIVKTFRGDRGGQWLAYQPDIPAEKKTFNRIATFPVCMNLDPTCNTDDETVAEIVDVSDDGMTLVYTDSEMKKLGFIDISDPSTPEPAGTVDLVGEPTSVAVLGNYALVGINTSEDYVNTSGSLVAIDMTTKIVVKSWDLGGQPDSVAVSPDNKYVVIAIENERDEDLGDGKPPQVSKLNLIIPNSTR